MEKYRVIVLREGATEDETLFEIAGPAAMVAKLAPGALLDALDADGDRAEVPSYVPPTSLADRVFDSAVAAGNDAAADSADTEAAKTKRNRRTKAQIAADKEAVGLGFRDAAHRAEVESQQQIAAGVAASPAPAAYVPPAGEVVVGSVPGAIVTEAPAAAPAPPVNGEAPWNPFTQS